MKTRMITMMLAAMLIVTISCEETTTSEMPSNENKAAMSVSMVDAPAGYDAVLVHVTSVEYKLSSSEADSTEENEADESSESWKSIDMEPMVYDLLELNNGTEAVLADLEISSGQLEEVRVILGSDNALVIGEDTTALTVPSGSASGLKIKINEEIEAGMSYKLILDFDAGQSIVAAGMSGKFNLKPVIRATLENVNEEPEYGAISGVVWPDSISTVVYAVDTNDDSVSTMPEENGTYLIDLLAEGEYTISAVPADSTEIESAIAEEIMVSAGQTTAADTLQLSIN